MWIFTPEFAVSIVQHNDDHSKLIVRSRQSGDIERFLGGEVSAESTPTFDYPYRLVAPRDLVVAAMARSATDLGYGNVKGAVHERERAKVMYAVYEAYRSSV